MELPSKCLGCPFYQYKDAPGNGFVPDAYVKGSKVMFIAQNGGDDEVKGHKLIRRHYHGGGQHSDEFVKVQPQPLIGSTGHLFDSRFLPLSGLKREEVSVGNAIRCRPGVMLGLKPNELPSITTKMRLETSKADIVKALKWCRDAYLEVPSSTELIVTMGRYAQFSLTGIQNEDNEYGKKQGVMESWRGYGVDSVTDYRSWPTINTKVYDHFINNKRIFFTMHIASLFKGESKREDEAISHSNKKFFHATLQDFYKIKLILAGKWPKPVPTWLTTPPIKWPSYAAFDTEYYPDTYKLIRWSLCDTSNNLWCVEASNIKNDNIPVQVGSTILIQNALADINHLGNIIDIGKVQIEDMMLAHSVLWTGEPHSLNYINSVYGKFNRYKHLIHEDGQQQLYSALDVAEPMYEWKTHFIPEFRNDPQSWSIYKNIRLELINIIDKAQKKGAKLNGSRLLEVQQIVQDKLVKLQLRAREITGDDMFNLGGSKRLKEEIYEK